MDANISPNITASPANLVAGAAAHSDKLHKPMDRRPSNLEQEQRQTTFNTFVFQQRAARLLSTRQPYSLRLCDPGT